jgi:hypothetical protein
MPPLSSVRPTRSEGSKKTRTGDICLQSQQAISQTPVDVINHSIAVHVSAQAMHIVATEAL